MTIAAGQQLTGIGEGSNDLLTDLGLNEADLDNSSGSTPLVVTSMLTTPPTTSSPPAPSTSARDISTRSGAQAALPTLQAAIAGLAGDRAVVGSGLARLSYTSAELGTLQDNLSAANSQIADVDVAQESTNYARYSILTQAGTAMLAQANSNPQSVLHLLS